jgi:2-haloacid dehalogenase
MTAETLKAIIKVCMFDQYGTVVDMQKGLTEVVTPYLKDLVPDMKSLADMLV